VEALSAIRSRADVAVPALRKALRDPDWYVRSEAGRAIGEYGVDAKSALPDLTSALKDKDGHVKVAAAFALYKIGGKTEPAVPVLIQTLNRGDETFYSPHSAARTLGRIGPPAKAAVPHLTAALSKDNRGLRICAAGALWKITKKPEPALPVLIQALQDGTSLEENSTGDAIDMLEDMGPEAKAAVPALLAARKQAEGWARERVERVLKKIDPDRVQ
jgi:HEAT repeat protein